MSFWSGGYLTPFDTPKGKHIYNLHKIAVHYINKNYGECHLITDSRSKKYLKNLPFKTISTELNKLNKQKSKNWALGKLLAYKIISEKNEPFLHLDYDVFLTKPLPENILNSDVLVQSEEKYIYMTYGLSIFDIFVGNRYDLENVSKNDQAYNMGVFGGKDLSFIKEYAERAIQFTLDNKNKKLFEMLSEVSSKTRVRSPDELNNSTDKGAGPGSACVPEQYYLWKYAKKKDKKITCLFYNGENETDSEIIKRHSEESKILGYVHLNYKKYDLPTMITVQKNIEAIDKGLTL
jgi:hypothetical protein